MIKVTSDADRVLVAKFHEAAQDQVFASWDRLSAEEQGKLLAQLHALDLNLVRKLIAQYLQGTQEKLEARVLTPAPVLSPSTVPGADDEAIARGEDALRKGQIGIVTAAGEIGMASGFDKPRGLYPIGPVSGKTLFRHHAEKIRAIARKYRAAPLWVIGTSPHNHQATLDHFKTEDWFGLNRADISFVVQDELPVINRRGKILLEEPGRIAMAPNGHGGVLMKVLSEEVFGALQVRGLQHLFYFQVDNPLARLCEPAFLGHHILAASDLSSKAVSKVDPEEKVGIFCRFNGTLGVVEHRELGQADQRRRDAGGRLEFRAANIGIHVFSMAFLDRLRQEALELSYHFADRKTSYIDRKGSRVVPRQTNSIQFECFVFDTLPLARSTLILEANREEEFSPVKSLNGRDSLTTARKDLSRLYARWLLAAGARAEGGDGAEIDPVEISPLFALDAAELKAKLEGQVTIESGLYLE
jgi:UDP-N-acetylglucosamine/UDP-N-acetylgalactosamine diphosphorylase